MTDDDQTLEQPSSRSHRGPNYVYSSPSTTDTAITDTATADAGATQAAAAASPRPSRGFLALAGAALMLLVLMASAAGATIAHEFWAKPGSASAVSGLGVSSGGSGSNGSGNLGGSGSSSSPGGAPGTSNGSGGFSIGGITIGPGGISIGGSGGSSVGSGGSGVGSGGPANSAAVAAKVAPALVDVNSTFGNQAGAGAGTGIVLSSNGRVLTNNHVIDGATRITATDVGNGRTYEATVVGYDQSHDIAVLQLQGASGLATATLGDSSKLSVGDPVLGIGNAGGVGGTPSSAGGRITALDQTITAGDELGGRTERLSGLIQTNADIQAGDSGGPLVDAQGRVIGMITAGASGFGFGFGSQGSSGQAFAIPIDQASKTASEILAGHASDTVHIGPTAFLGVQVASPAFQGLGGFGGSGSATSGSGVSISGVVTGRPAQKAGLNAGDVITSLDGHPVGTADDLGKVMLRHHPGDTVRLGWTNASGQSQTSSIQLATGPPA
jgi:S1-C subfamily serine protease